MLDEHQNAIRTMLRRAYLVNNPNDSGQQQLVDVSGFVGDQPSQIVRLQHYGLSSVPPVGGEGIILSKGGRSNNAWMLGLEHPDYRPTATAVGGTVLYDSSGNAMKLIGQNVVFTFNRAGWQVTSDGAVVDGQGGVVTVHSATRINLGKGASAAVMTTAGPSSKVFAVT